MDPNENMAQQRQIAARIMQRMSRADAEDRDYNKEELVNLADLAVELAELTQSLDEWLSRGGFKPKEWE